MRKAVIGAVAGVVLGAFSMVSAVEMSAGVRGLFTTGFGGGLMGFEVDEWTASHPLMGSETEPSWKVAVPYNGGGIGTFLDVTYAEIGIDLVFGGGKGKHWEDGKEEEADPNDEGMSFMALNLGLVGKYPIPLADNMTFFPFAGFEYMMVMSATEKYKGAEDYKWDGKTETETYYGETYTHTRPKASELSRFGLKLGAGMDISLADNMFLRPMLSYNIRFANKMEKDFVDELQKEMQEVFNELAEWGVSTTDVEIRSLISHGLTISVGLGFRF